MPISRGSGSVNQLPDRRIDLDDLDPLDHLTFEFQGSIRTIEQMLVETYTDAFVVIQDGALVREQYFDGMRSSDTHLLMSVSKSLTGVLAGILIERGVIDLDVDVPTYVAELRGTAWDGCTIEHLLNMRAGTRFTEDDYDDPDNDGRLIEFVSGYMTHDRVDLPANTAEWIRQLRNDGAHGGNFRYRSILPDVLAWVLEAATGLTFAKLFADLVWSRIGAEHDANIIVDAVRFPVVEGGISASAMDVARFGLMCLQRGSVVGTQVVPASWINRLHGRDDELIEAYRDSSDPRFPSACYRDFWWVMDPDVGIYSGHGINGQTLLVHHPSNAVIVKLSTWPDRMDEGLAEMTETALLAICEELAGQQRPKWR